MEAPYRLDAEENNFLDDDKVKKNAVADKEATTPLSKRIVYTLFLLLIISVAINLIILVSTIQKESLAIKDSLQNVSSSVTSKAESTTAKIEKTRINILSSITTNADETCSRFDKSRDDILNYLAKDAIETFSRFDKSRDDILKCLAKDAIPAGNSAEVNKKQAAAGQRALDLGAKALKAEEYDKALLYFINGVNHDPSRLELIQSVAGAAMKSQNADLAERAVGVLELATMQVSADDMTAVLDLIGNLRAKISPASVPKLSPEDASKRIEELWTTYKPEAIWADNGKISEGLSGIESFEQSIDMSRTDETDTRFSATLSRSDMLAKQLRNIQSYLPLYQHVVSCSDQLMEIASAKVPDPTHYSSVSASAHSILAQLWGGSQTLPKEMREKLNTLPKKLQDTQEIVQKKLSTPAFNRAKEKMNSALAKKNDSYTQRIKELTDAIEQAIKEAETITSSQMRTDLFDQIKKARDGDGGVAQLELERRAAYQKWALARLNAFMTAWNNEKSVSDEEAKNFFHSHQIARIDESLLIPEVSRVLQRVLQCMTGEVNAKEGSNIEYQMANTNKQQLGAF